MAGAGEIDAAELEAICGTAGGITGAARDAGTFEASTLGWLVKAAFAPESTETVRATGAPELCFERP